jgi:DNA replication protein DnaC
MPETEMKGLNIFTLNAYQKGGKMWGWKCDKCAKIIKEENDKEVEYRDSFYNAIDINKKIDLFNSGLKNCTFAKFKTSPETKIAFDKARNFIESGKSLYLFGGVGCGKTHLLWSAFRESVIHQKKATIINVTKLVRCQREEFETREEAELRKIDEIIKGASPYDEFKEYLFIDDMNAENSTGRTAELLYMLLNEIIERNIKIFITSNKSVKYISDNISDRVASRICGLCGKENIIKIEGMDWRTK